MKTFGERTLLAEQEQIKYDKARVYLRAIVERRWPRGERIVILAKPAA
jgi:hypothetical protein